MRILTDCFGQRVRLTDERLVHILEHPEMRSIDSEIEAVVNGPHFVRRSRSDANVRMFYKFCPETIVGGKWLCVVIKYAEGDAFVVTAYLTSRAKAGEDLWQTK